MEVIRISSFDGQSVWLDQKTELFDVGNFLGGGAAGNVYECEQIQTHARFALKILNPLGYKILSPSLLKRCTIVLKGKSFNDAEDATLKKEHVWWVVNGPSKQYLACYYSDKQQGLRELSLPQCIEIWGTDVKDDNDDNIILNSLRNNIFPNYPPKYLEFLRKRSKIFREITNMRKISNHKNVIRLEGVLELIQESKSTLFLVMELANGGELFDRIKIDCGTKEETAIIFFKQLLEGVKHCHDQGVCHRDLKPENLLLQDDGVNGTILKIADFGFSAHFNEYNNDDDDRRNAMPASTFHTPPKGGQPLKILKSIVGSPFYVAPEVMQSGGYDGTKVDVWSLGVILYAMLAGNLPFGQDLANCKRFRHFCKWVKEQTARGVKFWDDPNVEYPQWLFTPKFSPASKGLIVAMLHPDPKDRITVVEAMKHKLCGFDMNRIHSEEECHSGRAPIIENRLHIVQPTQPQQLQDAQQMEVTISNESNPGGRTISKNSNRSYSDDDEVAMFKMEEEEDTAEEKEASHSNDSPAFEMARNLEEQKMQVVQPVSDGSHGPTLSSSYSSVKNLPLVPPAYLSSQPVRDLIVQSPEEVDEDEGPHSPLPSQSTTSSTPSVHHHAGAVNNYGLYRQESGGSDTCRNIPAFNDRQVKRSTRFITSVPAEEVLSKINSILQEVKTNRIETPAGYITRIDLNWDYYRLEVYGQDTLHHSASQPIVALQLYQLPNTMVSLSCSPTDYNYTPSQSYGSWMLGQRASQQPQLMVEFIRGQLEIFAYKRFYQWVRLKLSELVKKDFAMSLFDQAGSPMFDRMMHQRYQPLS